MIALRAAVAAVALLLAASLAACGAGASGLPAPSPSMGSVIPTGHPVPSIPLVDQDGRAVTLQSFRGKYVVFAQFLTLCQEECPLTTGTFETLDQSVHQAGLGSKVAFVEATVDPGRDTPARLRAYRAEFGASWTLLTGTPTNIAALWKRFGIFYQRVGEGSPAAIDWWTHKPLTYDIDHTNGFILIDPAGNERFLTQQLPLLHGQLAAKLKSLLNAQGLDHLRNGITGQGYTIPQALAALSWLVGRSIPLAHHA